MKRCAPALLAFAFLFSVGRAGPTEQVVVAAMHLSDQPNYSWVTSVSDDARSYEVMGQTERGGFTRVKMPVVNSIRRRLGRSITDTQIEAVFKGNVHCVFNTDEGWKTIDELPPPEALAESGDAPLTTITRLRGSLLPRPEEGEKAYSNLQLSICHPHEELGIIVTSHTDLQVDGDVATGKLNDLGAQLLLVHDGQPELTPLSGTGTFKLWMRDGAVVRYRISLEGVIAVDTAGGARRDIRVRQTMDTTLKAVGETKVDVPDEARRKLK